MAVEAKKSALAGEIELLFVDESTVTLDFDIRACWMKRGKQKRLPAPPGARAFHHIIGALNWRSQAVNYTVVKRKNSESFIGFLEQILEVEYREEVIVLVMDNAPYHRSREVQAMLSHYDERLLVFWLPAYCPTLNPIERYWRHMKDKAIANTLFSSNEALLKNLKRVLAAQNKPGDPLRLTFSHY